jgi:hypothetical protein
VIHYFLVSNDDEDRQVPQKDDAKLCSSPVGKNYQPNPSLQKAIQKQIVNLCPTPEHRNFFYLPAM